MLQESFLMLLIGFMMTREVLAQAVWRNMSATDTSIHSLKGHDCNHKWITQESQDVDVPIKYYMRTVVCLKLQQETRMGGKQKSKEQQSIKISSNR